MQRTPLPAWPNPSESLHIGEKDCLEYVRAHATSGDASSVIAAIDTFAHKHQWMMNVGDDKGPIVDDIIRKVRPRVVCELGGYVGYSAIRFASLVRELHQGDVGAPVRYFSFELSPEFAAIAAEHIKLAGLQDVITIVVGPFAKSIGAFRDTYAVDTADFVFIDHEKSHYLPDLLHLEGSGLLRQGTTIVADNVIYPGAPDYLNYVRTNANYKTEFIESFLEYTDKKTRDGLEVSEWQSVQ